MELKKTPKLFYNFINKNKNKIDDNKLMHNYIKYNGVFGYINAIFS